MIIIIRNGIVCHVMTCLWVFVGRLGYIEYREDSWKILDDFSYTDQVTNPWTLRLPPAVPCHRIRALTGRLEKTAHRRVMVHGCSLLR